MKSIARSGPLLLVVAVSVLLTGCFTAQVRQAVRDANQEIVLAYADQALVAELTGATAAGLDPTATPNPTLAGTTKETLAQTSKAIQRIDVLIEKHPDQTAVVHALQLRKAILLMVSGQENLANATFRQLAGQQMLSARDQALVNNHEVLTWWWKVAPATRALPAAAVFKQKAAAIQLPAEAAGGMKAYLIEVRACIVAKRLNTHGDPTTNKAQVLHDLQQGLRDYAGSFSAADRQSIRTWYQEPPDLEAIRTLPLDQLRRYGHVKTIFRYYQSVAQQLELAEADWLTEDLRWLKEL